MKKRGGGGALKSSLTREGLKGLNCAELKDSDDEVGCLWVRIRGKSKTDIPGGVCYRPPRQTKGQMKHAIKW